MALTDRQRQRFQNLRESGQGNKARRFRKRALRKANQTTPAADPAVSGASPQTRPTQSIFGGDRPVSLGPKMSNQLAKGAAVGQELVDRFLPDISALGTLDASRAPETQNLINQQSAFATQAAQRSPEMAAAITRAEQGLGGLNAAENDALRAQAFQSLDRQFQAGNRALARAQGRSGVQGAAATGQFRDLARERLGATQGLERDILLQNIAIQDQRRNALANLISGTEAAEFGRGQQSLGQLQALTQAAQASEQAREQFNLGQQANLLAGQQGLFFGGMGLFEGKRNALANQRAAEEAQQAAIANAQAQAQAFQQQALATQNLLSGLNLPSLGGII